MSEKEKGELLERAANLPPELQMQAKAYAQGLSDAYAALKPDTQDVEEPQKDG